MTAAVALFLIKSSLFLLPALVLGYWRCPSAAERHALTLIALLALPVMASIHGWLDWRIALAVPEHASPVLLMQDNAPTATFVTSATTAGADIHRQPYPAVARSALPLPILVYLLVAGVLGLRALLSWLRITRHVRLLPRIDALACSLDLPPHVVLCWGDCASPWTWGIRRTVVVLPRGFAGWCADKQQHALGHELAHVQRRDSLTQTIGHALAILFWFQPLAWMLHRRLGQLAEQASDDSVLRGGLHAPEYAQWLLDITRAGSRSSPLGIAMGRHPLRHRIDAILDPSTRRIPMKTRHLLGIVLLTVGAAVPISALTFEPSLPDERDYLPVFKAAPAYPEDAQHRHIEGYAVVEFVVTENGTTADVRVVEESPPGVFGRSAIDAAGQFLYLPSRQRGSNVAVPGVRNRITYELARSPDGTIENNVRVDWEAAQSSLESSLTGAGDLDTATIERAAAAADGERRRHQRLLATVIERAEAVAQRTGNGDLYLQAAKLATSLQETGQAIHCLLRTADLTLTAPGALKIELAQVLIAGGRFAEAKALFADRAADDELSDRWFAYLDKEERRRAAVYQALSSKLQPVVAR